MSIGARLKRVERTLNPLLGGLDLVAIEDMGDPNMSCYRAYLPAGPKDLTREQWHQLTQQGSSRQHRVVHIIDNIPRGPYEPKAAH